MGMEVHLYDLEDEYIGTSETEDPPPDLLEWTDRNFRKRMDCDNAYIQVSYVSRTEQ